jgi:hypothetical protein
MSETVHFSQITEPELLDIVDNAWLQDKLPDDSEQPRAGTWFCMLTAAWVLLLLIVLLVCELEHNVLNGYVHASTTPLFVHATLLTCRCSLAPGHAWIGGGGR